MKILLSTSSYIQFIRSFPKVVKSVQEDWLRKIISNTSTLLVTSGHIISCIEDGLISHPKELMLFQEHLKMWHDEGRLTGAITSSADCNDSRKGLQEFNDFDLGICLIEQEYGANKGFVAIDSIAKPNIHWLMCNVAALTPNNLKISFTSLTGISQIESFFDNFFNFIPAHNAHIFDRYFNVDMHTLFRSLIGREVTCHTIRERKASDFSTKITKINTAFPTPSVLEVFIGPKEKIHERKIIIKNFIITCDEDFANLSRVTWEINISYDISTANAWSTKAISFTKNI